MVARLLRSAGIMARMVPYLLYLFGVRLIGGLSYFVVLFVLVSVARSLAAISETLGYMFFAPSLLALTVSSFLLRMFERDRADAGFIAVATEIMQRGSIPEGTGQIAFGRRVWEERLNTGSDLPDLERKARLAARRHGVFGGVHAALWLLRMVLDRDTKQDTRYRRRILDWNLTGLVRETLLSRRFTHPEEEPWRSNIRAAALYEKLGGPVHTEAEYLVIGAWATTCLLFLVPTMTVALLLQLRSVLVLSLLAACVIKVGFFNPLGTISAILHFDEVTQGAVVDTSAEEAEVEDRVRHGKQMREDFIQALRPG